MAHVKVEADLTKTLPSSGELVRESGEIVPVDIDYPWMPPSCTHCGRIGHILKNCIYPPAKANPSAHDDDRTTETTQIPSVNLQGYSPHVVMDDPPLKLLLPPRPLW